MNHTKKHYPVDNSAILYLAQMGKDHTNSYRFSAELPEAVCPDDLQKAANRIYTRFPTIVAGYHPGFFDYTMVPASRPPRVLPDPGLLHTMTRQEIETCAYRIFYSGNVLCFEAFHASADGYGALISLRALVAEYLYIHYGVDTPERRELLETGEPDWETELHDAYLDHGDSRPRGIPGRYSYQLPGAARDNRVKSTETTWPTETLQAAAKRFGVSMTAFLSTVMAEAVMEVQKKHIAPGKEAPVRIMVPIDLRRIFPSRTLRNFILYALPTLEPEEITLPLQERMTSFRDQLRSQVTPEALAPVIARNVRVQKSPVFRIIPRGIKCTAMRIAYRFFGESNSSITMTNLGLVSLSPEMAAWVRNIQVFLTPRRHSPYNCGIISCGDQTNICITRFGAEPELENLFFGKLQELLK